MKKIFKALFLPICSLGLVILNPQAVSAGGASVSVVISVDTNSITLDDAVTVTIGVQKLLLTCTMDGTISLYMDGDLVNSFGVSELSPSSTNPEDKVVELDGMSDFAAPGEYELTADYQDSGSGNCGISALSTPEMITVLEATTTTAEETTTTDGDTTTTVTEDDTTTTADSLPEETVLKSGEDELADSGSSLDGSTLAIASLLIAAGAGLMFARRRA